MLSPWLGLETARHLEQKYGQPFLHEPAIPIGARLTGGFLRRVASFAGLPREAVEAFIARDERDYYLYLRDFSAFYAGCTSQYSLASKFAIIGESAYTLAIARFLAYQLGLVPGVPVSQAKKKPAYLGRTRHACLNGLYPAIMPAAACCGLFHLRHWRSYS